MARQNLSKSLELVKDFIKNNTVEKNEWTTLTIPQVCSRWQLPQYVGRIILIRLRLDPEIRVKLAPAVSRYKPKSFYYDTPENKLKYIEQDDQFELKSDEIKILMSKFKDFKTVEKLQDFTSLMYIIEKLKTSALEKNWAPINIIEICKLMDITESNLLSYLSILTDLQIIIQSPYTLNYKLTIDDAARKQAMHELDYESTDPEVQAKGKLNIEALSAEFDNLKTVNQLRSTIQSLMDLNGKNNAILMNQIKIIDALATEEKNVQLQKQALARLNQSYNELLTKYDKLKDDYKETSEQNRLLNIFFKDYHTHIVNESTELIAYLSSVLESYFKLPAHKKNDMVINNKTKVELLNTIMEYQKKITTYKGKING